MDAITLLKTDHKAVEALFKRFEKAGPRAFVEKREIVDRIIEALSVHASIEEQLFYPVARATVPDVEDIALESLEEHHIVKWVLRELEGMTPEDERFDAKVTVLMENVRHHVEEEEQDFFPKVRDELGRNALRDLGDAMVAAQGVAPTHPHPEAPDTPPGNLLMGPAVGVADRIGDTVSGLAQGGVTAVGDIIATVLRRKKPSVTPTGSRGARHTATKVRADADDATQAVIDGARKATASTKSSAKSARTSAKKAASSAKRSAAKTASTAKRSATKTTAAATRSAAKTASTAKRSATKTAPTAKRSATKTGSSTATRARRAA